MITPIGTHRQVQADSYPPLRRRSVTTMPREFYVHLTTLASTSRRQQRRQRFQSHEHQKQHQDRIRDDLLQGPISSDIKKQYRDRLDELLRAEGILLPRPPKTNNRNPVYIFTDGSCGKTNNSIAGWGVVAYETEQIEASLMNNTGKHTVTKQITPCAGRYNCNRMRGTFWVLAIIQTTLRKSRQLDMPWSWLEHDTKSAQSPSVVTVNTRPLFQEVNGWHTRMRTWRSVYRNL